LRKRVASNQSSVAEWINDRTILSKPYAPMPDDTGAGVELGDQ
jgi:hypothetical protein